MAQKQNDIKLNDILNIANLASFRIRFNIKFGENWNPIEYFINNRTQDMLDAQYWNGRKTKHFTSGQTTLGFLRIQPHSDLWLLFHSGQILEDLNVYYGVGYKYEIYQPIQKYVGRLIIKYENKSQKLIRKADAVMEECIVHQILPPTYDLDIFQDL